MHVIESSRRMKSSKPWETLNKFVPKKVTLDFALVLTWLSCLSARTGESEQSL